MNRKALSPLIATIILVTFALIIGTITMSWGKTYVQKIDEEEQSVEVLSININQTDPHKELKQLQLDYLKGQISIEEYISKEKSLLRSSQVN